MLYKIRLKPFKEQKFALSFHNLRVEIHGARRRKKTRLARARARRRRRMSRNWKCISSASPRSTIWSAFSLVTQHAAEKTFLYSRFIVSGSKNWKPRKWKLGYCFYFIFSLPARRTLVSAVHGYGDMGGWLAGWLAGFLSRAGIVSKLLKKFDHLVASSF